MMDKTNSRATNRAIFENENIESNTTRGFEVPTNHCFNEIVAIYESSSNIECLIKMSSGEDFSSPLSSGISFPLPFEKRSDYGSITVKSSQKTSFTCIASFVDMSLMSPILDEKIILQHPEHGKCIGFDFEECEQEAAGWDEIYKTEVQIRGPDGIITTITKSNSKFIWRGKRLYCELSTGYLHAIRVRYKSDKWTEWSKWLNFIPKRRMSL